MRSFSQLVDYVITYRQSTPDRENALHFVAAWIHNAFPDLNIIIVEQDSHQKLGTSELSYCQHKFIYNPGLFNRGWAFNVGATLTERPYLIFGDADIFMQKSAYLESFHYLREFQAVDPKKNYVWNVSDIRFNPLRYDKSKIRYGNTFAGGVFFISRACFLSIGMWDEDFEGWGGEDNVMEHIIRCYLRQCRLQLDVLHINHQRLVLDGKGQPHYEQNSKLSKHICSLHGERLQSYMERKKLRLSGSKSRYNNSGIKMETGGRLARKYVVELDNPDRIE